MRRSCAAALAVLLSVARAGAQTNIPVTIITTLPEVMVDEPVAIALQARGGTGPYTWKLLGSTSPQYLTLSSEGILSGTPRLQELQGNDFWTFAVRATDINGASATREYRVMIFRGGATPDFVDMGLPVATVGTAYHASFLSKYGTPPYAFSHAGGSLPPGLTLAGDVVAGTPAAAGTFLFDITVSDSRGRARTKAFTIRVADAGDNSVVPEQLASGLDDPSAIAVDATHAYWVEWAAGLVRRVPRAGGPAATLYDADRPIRALALDATHVYFSDGDLKRVPKAGGTAITLASNEDASGIAVDATHVYWTNDTAHALRSVPLSGGTVTTLATGVGAGSEVALDGGQVYWSDGWKVHRMPVAGGASNSPSGIVYTPRFVVDNARVYMTGNHTPTTGSLFWFSWQPGSSVWHTLESGLVSPWDLALDNGWVFWIETHPTGAVRQVSVNRGASLTLATDVPDPVAIATDTTHVYWVARDGGTAHGGSLWRVAKAAPSIDVERPVITITPPLLAPTYTQASQITLTGTARDNFGVTHVRWSNDRGGTGAATGISNWTAGPIDLYDGQNRILVEASDAAGWISYDAVWVIYTPWRDQYPTVRITSPTDRGSYTSTQPSLNLAGTASDDVGLARVSWVNDRGGSGTASGTMDWSATIPLQPGLNEIVVTAHDSVAQASTRRLTVTYAPPVTAPPARPMLISPSGSTDVQTPTFTWNATYGTTHYELWVNDSVQKGRIAKRYTAAETQCGAGSGICTATPRIRLAEGAVTWWVMASNAFGHNGWSQPETFTILPDAIPPQIQFRWALPSSTDLEWFRLEGTTSDNGAVTHVTWANDRGGGGTATGTATWSATVFLHDGVNVLTVTARDEANNRASVTWTVTFAASSGGGLTAPAPVSPVTTITAPRPTFMWTAVRNAGDYEVLAVDSTGNSAVHTSLTAWAAGCPDGTGTCSVYPTFFFRPLAPGSARWWVRARNNMASSGWSAGAAFTVDGNGDSTAPALTITTPKLWFLTTDSSPVRFAGTASDNTGVSRVTWANSGFASGTASGTTNWTADIPLHKGENYVEVTAYDAAGNPAKDDVRVTFTGNGPPPAPAARDPWSGITTVVPTFVWFGTPEATHYDLRVNDAAQDSRIYVSVTAMDAGCPGGRSDCAVSLGVRLAPGLATWSVRAVNAFGASQWTPALPFSMRDDPDTAPPDIDIMWPNRPASTTSFESIPLRTWASDNFGNGQVAEVTWTNDRGGSGRTSARIDSTSLRLQPGDNFITVTARDPANNVATATATVTYLPEAGALPVPAQLAPADRTIVNTFMPSFTWTMVGGATKYKLLVDDADDSGRIDREISPEYSCNAAAGTCTYSADTWSRLSPGNATWWVQALGPGVKSAWSQAVQFQVVNDGRPDRTPPTIAITRPIAADAHNAYSASLTIGGTASDDLGVGGVVEVTWRNSRGGLGVATGTTTWSATMALQLGVNVITVSTRDAAGNTASDTLTVTYIPLAIPPAPTAVSPTGAINSRTPTFTWNASSGATEYELLVNDAAQNGRISGRVARDAAGCGAGAGICSVTHGVAIAPGNATWLVRASNPAGDSAWSVPMTFNVIAADTVAPTLNIASPTSAGTYSTISASVTVAGAANDDVAVTHVTWTNDRGGSGTANGTTNWSATVALQSGTNVLTVTGRDAANNSATARLTVTYVAGPPSPPTLASPAGTITTRTPSFTWNASPGAERYEVWVNDAAQNGRVALAIAAVAAGCAAGTGTCTVSPGVALAFGSARWWVLASNFRGNSAWSTPLSFTVAAAGDSTAPTVTVTTPTSAATFSTTSASLVLGGTSWDNVGVAQVTWTDGHGGSGTAGGTTTWSATVTLRSGVNVLTVTARDAANNTTSATLTVTYTAPAGPPSAPTLVSPAGAIATDTPAFTWNASSGTTRYHLWVNDTVQRGRIDRSVTASDAGCASGTGQCSLSPGIALATGAATWWVLAGNAAGDGPWSAPLTFAVSAAPDTTLPTVAITTPTSAAAYSTTSASLTLGGTARDNVGVTQVTWTSDRGGSGTAGGTTTWSATVLLQSGANVVTVTVRDAANNAASATLTVTYTAPSAGPPPPPILVSPSGTVATQGPTFTWSASTSATHYHLWVNDVGLRGRIDLRIAASDAGCASGTGQCSLSPAIALASGRATWWVLAGNTAGDSTWSAPMTFTVP